MEKDPKQTQSSQPQGPQPQGQPPQAPQVHQSLQAAAAKAQEQLKHNLSRAQEYQKQLSEAQAKYFSKTQAAWTAYYEKSGQAYNEYTGTVRDIHEGEKKASLQAPQKAEEASPAENLEAFKEARLKAVRQANEVHVKLRGAEQKYNQKLGSFWDDVWASVSEAVNDFWNWISDWWEEPPVEGGGGAAPFRAIADPAWRAAFDPAAAAVAYYGWNYGTQLY